MYEAELLASYHYESCFEWLSAQANDSLICSCLPHEEGPLLSIRTNTFTFTGCELLLCLLPHQNTCMKVITGRDQVLFSCYCDLFYVTFRRPAVKACQSYFLILRVTSVSLSKMITWEPWRGHVTYGFEPWKTFTRTEVESKNRHWDKREPKVACSLKNGIHAYITGRSKSLVAKQQSQKPISTARTFAWSGAGEQQQGSFATFFSHIISRLVRLYWGPGEEVMESWWIIRLSNLRVHALERRAAKTSSMQFQISFLRSNFHNKLALTVACGALFSEWLGNNSS